MFSRVLSSWGRLVRRQPHVEAIALEEERRIWVRFPCAVETTLRRAGPRGSGEQPGPERLAARVQNVSRGGINLIVDRPFEPGELLSVELPAGADDSSSTVLAYVVRVAARSGGEWTLGCTFAAELGETDLQSLGARRARATSPDQRAWTRFPCQAQASFQRARDPRGDVFPAQVLDISASGVGLRVEDPVPIGELLSVDLRDSQGRAVLNTLTCVVRVTVQASGDTVLGCNFIAEIDENRLQALV